jgi:hypothetical protein
MLAQIHRFLQNTSSFVFEEDPLHTPASCDRFFHERFRANPYQRRTKTDAVADMLTAWGLLGVSVIDLAWDIYLE